MQLDRTKIVVMVAAKWWFLFPIRTKWGARGFRSSKLSNDDVDSDLNGFPLAQAGGCVNAPSLTNALFGC